jgi:hypothetical protein
LGRAGAQAKQGALSLGVSQHSGTSIYGNILVQTNTIEEQEKLIQQLQQQLRAPNRAQFMTTVGRVQRGKNATQKMIFFMDSQDECNINRISHIICQTIWPCNEILPTKWTTFRDHPQSMCQLIMTKMAIPDGVTQKKNWESQI